MCPNLKGVHLRCAESERSLEISDQVLYEFLKILLGEFSRLEYIGIVRIYINETPQCEKLSFGGGMLKNLKKILIGKEYNFSEEEKQAICESLYKIAPNIDKSVNIFDYDHSSEDEEDE